MTNHPGARRSKVPDKPGHGCHPAVKTGCLPLPRTLSNPGRLLLRPQNPNCSTMSKCLQQRLSFMGQLATFQSTQQRGADSGGPPPRRHRGLLRPGLSGAELTVLSSLGDFSRTRFHISARGSPHHKEDTSASVPYS